MDLKNPTESAITRVFNGVLYTIPAEGYLAVPDAAGSKFRGDLNPDGMEFADFGTEDRIGKLAILQARIDLYTADIAKIEASWNEKDVLTGLVPPPDPYTRLKNLLFLAQQARQMLLISNSSDEPDVKDAVAAGYVQAMNTLDSPLAVEKTDLYEVAAEGQIEADGPTRAELVEEIQTATTTPPIIAGTPTVTDTYPANEDVGVTFPTPDDLSGYVYFSEEMDPSTITNETVLLLDESSQPIDCSVSYEEGDGDVHGPRAAITPSVPLSGGHTYRYKVLTIAADLAGNNMDQQYEGGPGYLQAPGWTRIATPIVIATSPGQDGEGFLVSNAISIGFNTEMDWDTTPPTDTVRLFVTGHPTPVPGTTTASTGPFDAPFQDCSLVITFTPDAPLDPGTSHTLSVDPTKVIGDNGSQMDDGYDLVFTTEAKPIIISIFQFSDSALYVGFSKNMDPGTITTSSLSLVDSDENPVSFSIEKPPGFGLDFLGVSGATYTVRLVPDDPLDLTKTHTIGATTDVADTSGLHLDEAFGGIVYAPSTVVSYPSDSVPDFDLDGVVVLTFNGNSIPMDTDSVEAAVSLTDGSDVAVPYAFAGDSAIYTLTPTSDLSPGSVYRIRVSTVAKSINGSHLLSDFLAEFTTAGSPTVVDAGSYPTDAENDLVINNLQGLTLGDSYGSVVFSENMDPNTIDNTTIIILDNGTPMTGVHVSYTDTTVLSAPPSWDAAFFGSYSPPLSPQAVFAIEAALQLGHTYKVRVTTGAKSAHAAPLAAQYTQATGFTVETTAPTVSSTSPVDTATAVSASVHPTVTFSEAMDPATITASNVVLLDTSNSDAEVPASVGYNTGSHVATITPTSPLSALTTYKIRVKVAVTDLSGNALASQYTQGTGFTTAA